MEKKYLIDNKELMKEWYWDKNKELNPNNITIGSHKKAWWNCEKGHEWNCEIKARIKGSSCPYCSGRYAIVGENDLITLNPQIANEWDYKKNNGKEPQMFKSKSNQKVWWICPKGHSYYSSIDGRTFKGRGCPYCANQKVLIGYNDLQSQYPELSKEWNYNKNTKKPSGIIAGSSKKVWWICSKGHEWQATINSRTRGNGCPLCSHELKTSFPEQALFFYLKKYFNDSINSYKELKKGITEIDIFIPSINTGIEYDGRYYHTNKERDLRKDEILDSNNITLYRVKEIAKESIKKETCIVNNCIFYNPDDNSKLNEAIMFVLKLLKVDFVESNINVEEDKTLIWNQYIKMKKKNSFLNRYPEIAKEWHPTKNGKLQPDMVTFSSGKKVWWKCSKCGFEWETRIASRSNGTDCPKCAGSKISKKIDKLVIGVNDLETLYPSITKEWHPTKNGKLEPSSVFYHTTKKVWWICTRCGNEWQAPVINRTRLNTGCQKCSHLKSDNILYYECPELMKEWDYNKNKSINPKIISKGSSIKVWWKCTLGHLWEARISHRVDGTGCPYCSNRRVLAGYNDLQSQYPELSREWNSTKNGNLTPENVVFGSDKKVWWQCLKCGHEWNMKINNRVKGSGCPICYKEERRK